MANNDITIMQCMQGWRAIFRYNGKLYEFFGDTKDKAYVSALEHRQKLLGETLF